MAQLEIRDKAERMQLVLALENRLRFFESKVDKAAWDKHNDAQGSFEDAKATVIRLKNRIKDLKIEDAANNE